MINIAVLEDDLYLQQRFKRILKGWDYVQQVFTCSDNAEFLACLSDHHIDILLADLDLPDGRGNQSIKIFSTTVDTAITIVISSSMDSAVILQAIADGAVGYVHKSDDSSEIIKVIKTAMAGDSPISPSIANKIVATLQSNGNDVPLVGILQNRTGRQPEDHGVAVGGAAAEREVFAAIGGVGCQYFGDTLKNLGHAIHRRAHSIKAQGFARHQLVAQRAQLRIHIRIKPAL